MDSQFGQTFARSELEIAKNAPAAGCSLEAAQAYTRWLATHHYENFHVVSFLLPKRLHQDFYNVYSYCRWADDLGDEIGDTTESLRLLGWWRAELDDMSAGRATHPVFAALDSRVGSWSSQAKAASWMQPTLRDSRFTF